MDHNEQYIRIRLDAIVDAWRKATPKERAHLLREKIRLQMEIEELRQGSPLTQP